ncbi:MAG: DUF1844 domain-containing protein [Deltaproteobacteria bacterium]
MPEEKEPGFKVVDRRLFGEDGRAREEEKRDEPTPTVKAEPPVTPARVEEPDDLPGGMEGEFAEVVQFLGTTAMFQLGLMQGPSGERIPADMMSARQTINMLEILERKTRGNLTAGEAKLLEEVLFELRMSFVELEKRAAKKNK